MNRWWRRGIFPCLWALAAVMARGAEAPPAEPEGKWEEVREATFTEVWDTVNEAYFDPTFGGVQWKEIRDKYHPRLANVKNKVELRAVLQDMLRELHRTHFAILPRETAIFTPAERTRIGTVGADFTTVGEEVVVERVTPATSAEQAGLKAGDVVVSINGRALAPVREQLAKAALTDARRAFYLRSFVISGLRRSVGTKVHAVVQTGAEPAREVELTDAAYAGSWSEPVGNFPSTPIEIVTERGADGVARISFNVFAPQLMKDLRRFLRTLQAGDGLVIDLRGNPGGVTMMASGLSGWLTGKEFSLGTMTMRQGFFSFEVSPQENAFTGPVAVLIDPGSASTSEILAAGLQEAKHARIFGETSAGAALPSSVKKLPTGDLFQFAIADMKTPAGKLIEGEGVVPDEIVPRSREDLAAGRDPVLAAARHWIEHERQAAKVTPPAQQPPDASP